MTDPRPFIWAGYQVEPLFTNIIDLTVGEKTVWENFSPSVRRNVKKAEKMGISVTIGSKEEMILVYNLLKGRKRIYATKEFMLDIFENFSPENLNFFVAKKDNTILTGIFTVYYKNKASVWAGSPRTMINGVSPNYIVHTESIRWACQNNYHYFEILGASAFSLCPFKSQFNGEVISFYNMKWYSPLNRFLTSLRHGLSTRNSEQLNQNE
jgi:lipid II:glycine glycyltransferase (peptidoglycan interpeptide bridge formation enzyme)